MRMYIGWSSRTLVGESYKVHKLCQRYIFDDVPLVVLMYLLFTRITLPFFTPFLVLFIESTFVIRENSNSIVNVAII